MATQKCGPGDTYTSQRLGITADYDGMSTSSLADDLAVWTGFQLMRDTACV
jgi:hypothetical protein|eukprot:COSAG01_NODE_1089_length_11778_cov_17.582242_8_plen_51_part_00